MRNLWTTVRSALVIVAAYWKRFASFLGRWNSRLLLTLMYVFFVGSMSMILKLLRKDLLDKKLTSAASYWRDKEPVDSTLERNTYQF